MIAFDVTPSGRVASIRRDGRTLSLDRAGETRTVDLGFEAIRCRFRDEDLVVLGRQSELSSIAADGTKRGVARVREDARDIAVLPTGSVLVGYGRRAGVTLERFGEAPCVFQEPAVVEVARLAAESGGAWLLGSAAEAPVSRALRLRPVPGGYLVRESVALPAPPRAATIGPDGALYVLLEPGASLLRVEAGHAGDPVWLPGRLHDLGRHGKRLLGCGDEGIVDLSRYVPHAVAERHPPELPPCS